ncbi:MAG: protein-disulfide reductase DsbD domain-containing protein [Chthoniobacterales bacterium]
MATLWPAQAQNYQGKTLVEPRLIADTTQVQAGKPFRVGVLLKMAEGWHTYWRYPGDSGLPTKIEWTLPPGFVAGELQWPAPTVDNEDGGLQVYVYSGEVLLFATVTPPKDWNGTPVEIGAKASWLVCEKLCVPGKAELQLTIPGNQENRAEFERYEKRIPERAPSLKVEWKSTGKALEFFIAGPIGDGSETNYFPNPPDGVLVGHPTLQQTGNGLTVTIPLLDGSEPAKKIPGVLQTADGSFIEMVGEKTPSATQATPASTSSLTLLPALLFGFIGGLILNLMPCVLPVISLKMFSFVKQAGESRQRVFRLGLAFAGGMFAWFLGIGVVLLILRSTGREISWAQQFQNPWFNIGIAVLIFLFALNLLGVYEITLPGSATTKLDDTGDGYGGAFFQGVFATILGTPCTAPYLGTTLAFALTQPAPALLSVFAAIALGMSAPYLLLCANPGWMRFLPKPGLWMVRLKEFMGFLLLATLLWFVWIVGRQLGIDAIVFLGALLLLCGLGAWIYGAFLTPVASPGSRRFGVIALLVVLGGIAVTLGWFRPVKETPVGQKSFAAELDRALAGERIVFVDFTADWCLSCKVNKRVAIDSAAVQQVFREKNVLFLEGDWTNGDPEITRVLKQYGRAGVPLYLIYPADRSRPAVVLPELLTPQTVLDALGRL